MQATFYLLAALIVSSVGVKDKFPSRRVSGRIIGGTTAAEGAAPHQASLRYNNDTFCAGSIIDTRRILSAAHCFQEYSAESMTVHVGTNQMDKPGVQYSVSKVICHAEYNKKGQLDNDIALLLLTTAVEYTSLIQPIALDRTGTPEGSEATLTGWGTFYYNGKLPNDLQTIQLSTISNSKCKSYYDGHISVMETEICTLTEEGKGACYGDSGGGLTLEGKLIGIASWSLPCAKGHPDVFTRVSSFVDWIDQNNQSLRRI